MRQFKYIENILLGVIAQTLAGNFLKDILQCHEIQAAVDDVSSRFEIPLYLRRYIFHQFFGSVFAILFHIRSDTYVSVKA